MQAIMGGKKCKTPSENIMQSRERKRHCLSPKNMDFRFRSIKYQRNSLLKRRMSSLSIMNSLRRRWKQSISSFRTRPGPVLSIGEGELAVMTYTSAVDKMKVFSAFIREGLENGDLVDCGYPDEESETFRAKLKEYGIDVEKYEREGALVLEVYLSGTCQTVNLTRKERSGGGLRRGLRLRGRDISISERLKTLVISPF